MAGLGSEDQPWAGEVGVVTRTALHGADSHEVGEPAFKSVLGVHPPAMLFRTRDGVAVRPETTLRRHRAQSEPGRRSQPHQFGQRRGRRKLSDSPALDVPPGACTGPFRGGRPSSGPTQVYSKTPPDLCGRRAVDAACCRSSGALRVVARLSGRRV